MKYKLFFKEFIEVSYNSFLLMKNFYFHNISAFGILFHVSNKLNEKKE